MKAFSEEVTTLIGKKVKLSVEGVLTTESAGNGLHVFVVITERGLIRLMDNMELEEVNSGQG